MNRRIVILFFFISALACAARAVLPPDAVARAPQIRAQSHYARQAYEKKLGERQASAVRAYEQTRADIFTPPWMRTGVHAAMLSRADSAAIAAAEKVQKRNHRLIASIMLLILIGAAAGWVRYATREIDNQY
jgi:hypothetical protein